MRKGPFLLALAGGLFAVLRPVWRLPHVEIDVIPLVLILVGLYILIPAPKRRDAGDA